MLIFLIMLNIYYSLYLKRKSIEKFEDYVSNIQILGSSAYTVENINDDNFKQCTGDTCGSTVNKLKEKNKTFLDTDSQYHKNYSYVNIVNKSIGYGKYTDIMNRDPLFAYRCLNISPKDLSDKLKKESVVFAHIYKKLYIYNEEMLVDFIQKQLTAVSNSSCTKYSSTVQNSENKQAYCDANMKLNRENNRSDKIQGPVYVIVSQSPYLRINEINKARFEIVKNQLPYFVEQRVNGNKITQKITGDENSEFSSLYAEVLIVFPLYTLNTITAAGYENLSNMQLDVQTTDPNTKSPINSDTTTRLNNERFTKFMTLINKYEINDELCNLKCNKGKMNCGCLNAKESDMDRSDSIPVQNRPYTSLANTASIKKYDSVCLAPDNTITNRSVMYYANPYSGKFIQLINNSKR